MVEKKAWEKFEEGVIEAFSPMFNLYSGEGSDVYKEEKEEKERPFLPLNLQFFASNDDDDDDSNNDDKGDDDNDNEFNETFSGVLEKFGADKVYQAFKEDNELFKLVQSDLDKHASKSIKGYEEKTLPEKLKAHEQEVLKKNGIVKDANQEYEERIAKLERENQLKDVRHETLKEFNEKDIPAALVDFVIDTDEEKMNGKKELFEGVVKQIRDGSEEHFMKKYTRKAEGPGDDVPSWKGKEPSDMTQEEYNAYAEHVEKGLNY